MTGVGAGARERRLATSEAVFARFGTPIVMDQALSGPLDPAVAAAVVGELCRLHPVLTAGIVPDGDGFLLRPGRPPALRTGLTATGAAAPFAAGEPLLRACLVEETPGRHRFVLAVHHAISDGTSALALLSAFWEAYTARVTGRSAALPEPVDGLAEPVEAYFRARFEAQDIAAYLRRRAETARTLSPLTLEPLATVGGGPGPGTGVHLHRLDVEPESVPRFLTVARGAGTAAQGLVCGIALCALRAESGAPPDASANCISAVDLRSRMRPVPPRHRLVMSAAFGEAVLAAGCLHHPLTAGREVWELLRVSARRGDPDRSIAAVDEVVAGMAVALSPTLVISNVSARGGAPALPPGLSAGRLSVHAEVPGPAPAVFLSTRDDGGLGINLTLPRAWFTAAQAQSLAQRMRSITGGLLDAG